jgi:hypothetical protein
VTDMDATGHQAKESPIAVATIKQNLISSQRAPVTAATVKTLADNGFSGDVVALARDLARA